MKVLALDIGLNHYGYSFWEDRELVSYGSEKHKAKKAKELDVKEKLDEMYDKVYALVSFLKPDIVLSEQMWSGFNASSFGKLSQLNGIIFAIGRMFNVQVEFINVRKYRTALGIKDKKHVFNFVKAFIDIENDDESDAIALGMYGIQNFVEESGINKSLVEDENYLSIYELIPKKLAKVTV